MCDIMAMYRVTGTCQRAKDMTDVNRVTANTECRETITNHCNECNSCCPSFPDACPVVLLSLFSRVVKSCHVV